MANVKAIIDVDINTSPAAAGLRSLQAKFNAFAQTLNTANASHSRFAKETSQQLSSLVNASQFFTAETVQMRTAASQLDMTLAKGSATMGQFFSARFRKDGMAAAQVLSLANARAAAMETQFFATGRAANGMREAIAVRPLQAFNSTAAVTAQRLAIQRAMLNQATTSMINFGKNTQWAGRQLMVGFTVPLTIFAGVAGKAFRDLEKEAVNFRKVYGDIFTTDVQTEEALQGVRDLSLEFTKYGVEAKKTMQLAAIAAQAGQEGAQLMAATTQATRLAVLGDMENQDAMRTTIALQSAFKMSNEDLAESINFLNMVENSSVLSLQDIADSIPRVAPVIQGLGGDVKDLSVMLVAMREGGVSAAEAANGLKSSLGRLITPSKQAKDMAASFGISLEDIVQKNAGNVLKTVMDLATAMKSLGNIEQQQLLSTIFGKFQYARIGALFENITRDGSQAQEVMEMMAMSTADMAATAEKELSAIEQSVSTKFTASIERMKVAIAPIGEIFVKMALPIVNFLAKIAESFNNLPDFAKNFLAFGAALVGVVIPAGTMFAGLLMNLIGTLVKVGHLIGLAFKGFMSGGLAGAISNVSQALNYMSLEQIDSANSATQLAGATSIANEALVAQVGAAAGAKSAVNQLGIAYDVIYQRLMKIASANAAAFGPGVAAMGAAGPATARAAAKGFTVTRLNKGGTAPGTGNKDTVPAMLTPGEFVVNKQATQENLPLLHAINDGQTLPGFNKGGRIPGMQYFNRFMSQRVVQPKLITTREDLLARVAALQETSSFSRVSPTQAAARVKMKEADAVYQEFMRQNAGGRTKNARVVKFAVEQLGISPTELGLSSRGNFGFALTPESNIKMQKGMLTKQDLLADIQNPNSLNPFADQFSRYFNGSVNREKFINIFEKSLGSVPVDSITNSRFEQVSRRALHEYLKSEGIPKQQRGSFMRDILTRTEVSSGLSSQRLEEALALRGITAERGSRRKEIYVNHNGERLNLGRLLGQEIGSLDKPQEIKRFTSQRDNKRLVPRGLVFAHANEGGMIPGVQYFNRLMAQRVVQPIREFTRVSGRKKGFLPRALIGTSSGLRGSEKDRILEASKALGNRNVSLEDISGSSVQRGHVVKGISMPGGESEYLPGLMIFQSPKINMGLASGNKAGLTGLDIATDLSSTKVHPFSMMLDSARRLGIPDEVAIPSIMKTYTEAMNKFKTIGSRRLGPTEFYDVFDPILKSNLDPSLYTNLRTQGSARRIGGDAKSFGKFIMAEASKMNQGGMIPGVPGYMAGARVNPALAALRKRRAKVVIAKDKDIDNIIFARNKDGKVDPDAFDILTLLRHNPNMNEKQLKNIQKYLAPRIKRGMSTRFDEELGYKVRDRQAGTWKTIARVMEERGYPVLKRNKGGMIPGVQYFAAQMAQRVVQQANPVRLLKSYMAGNFDIMQNAKTRRQVMSLAKPVSGTFYRGTQLGAGTLPKHIEREMKKAQQTGDFSKLIGKRFRMRGSDWSTDKGTAARFTELNQVKSKRDFLLYEKAVDEKILREASENLRMVKERGKPSWMPQSHIDQWEKSVSVSQQSLARINKELAKIGELSPLMIKAQGKIKGVPASEIVPDATYLGRGIKESNVISAGGMFEIRKASSGSLEIVPVQARNMGGPIFESGSRTIVPGVGNTDTVPAALTPGEFVVNKQSTRQNLPLLQAINSGGEIPMFNKGGMIPGMQYLRLGAVVNPMSRMRNAYRKMTDRGEIYFRGGLDSSARDPFSAQSLNFVAYQRRKFLKDKKIGSIGATKTPGRMSLAREDMQPPGQGLMFDPSPTGKPWTIGTMAVRPGYERVVAQLLGLVARDTIRRSGVLPGASTNLSAHSSKIVEMLSKRGIVKDLRPSKTDLNEIRKRDAKGMIKDSNDALRQSRYQWNVDPEEIQKSSNLVRSILRSTRPINTKRSEQLALFNKGGMVPGVQYFAWNPALGILNRQRVVQKSTQASRAQAKARSTQGPIYKRGEIEDNSGNIRHAFNIKGTKYVFRGDREDFSLPGAGKDVKVIGITPEALIAEALRVRPRDPRLLSMRDNLAKGNYGPAETRLVDSIAGSIAISKRGKGAIFSAEEKTSGYALTLASLMGDPNASRIVKFRRLAIQKLIGQDSKARRKEIRAQAGLGPDEENTMVYAHSTARKDNPKAFQIAGRDVRVYAAADATRHTEESFGRQTVHGAVNQKVVGHLDRNEPITNTVVLSKMSDVMKHNNIPGAMSNDIQILTNPGVPAVLPKALLIEPIVGESSYRKLLISRGLIKDGDPTPLVAEDRFSIPPKIHFLVKDKYSSEDATQLTKLLRESGRSVASSKEIAGLNSASQAEYLKEIAMDRGMKKLGSKTGLRHSGQYGFTDSQAEQRFKAMMQRMGAEYGMHSSSPQAHLEASFFHRFYTSGSPFQRFKGNEMQAIRGIVAGGLSRTSYKQAPLRSSTGKRGLFDVDALNKGGIAGLNSGNIVPGVGNTDTVPAMLTPGEFVINKKATQQNLNLLHAINSGKVAGFNAGGVVPVPQKLNNGGVIKMVDGWYADDGKGKLKGPFKSHFQANAAYNRMVSSGARFGSRGPAPAATGSSVTPKVPGGAMMRGMGPSMGLSMGGMGLMMVGQRMEQDAMMRGESSPTGSTLSNAGMGAMMASSLAFLPLPILKPLLALAAPIAAVGGGMYLFENHMNNAAEAAANFAAGVLGTVHPLQKMADLLGVQTPAKRRAQLSLGLGQGEVEEFQQEFGEVFSTEKGAEFIKDLQGATSPQRFEKLSNYLKYAIASGMMDRESAKRFARVISAEIGDSFLGARVVSSLAKQGVGAESLIDLARKKDAEVQKQSVTKRVQEEESISVEDSSAAITNSVLAIQSFANASALAFEELAAGKISVEQYQKVVDESRKKQGEYTNALSLAIEKTGHLGGSMQVLRDQFMKMGFEEGVFEEIESNLVSASEKSAQAQVESLSNMETMTYKLKNMIPDKRILSPLEWFKPPTARDTPVELEAKDTTRNIMPYIVAATAEGMDPFLAQNIAIELLINEGGVDQEFQEIAKKFGARLALESEIVLKKINSGELIDTTQGVLGSPRLIEKEISDRQEKIKSIFEDFVRTGGEPEQFLAWIESIPEEKRFKLVVEFGGLSARERLDYLADASTFAQAYGQEFQLKLQESNVYKALLSSESTRPLRESILAASQVGLSELVIDFAIKENGTESSVSGISSRIDELVNSFLRLETLPDEIVKTLRIDLQNAKDLEKFGPYIEELEAGWGILESLEDGITKELVANFILQTNGEVEQDFDTVATKIGNLNIAYRALEDLSPMVRKTAIITIATALGEGDPDKVLNRITQDFPNFYQLQPDQQKFLLDQYGQAFKQTADAAKELETVNGRILEIEKERSDASAEGTTVSEKERALEIDKEEYDILKLRAEGLQKVTEGQLALNAARAAGLAMGAGFDVPVALMSSLGIDYDSETFKNDAEKLAAIWQVLQGLPPEINLELFAKFLVFGKGNKLLDVKEVAEQAETLKQAFRDVQGKDPKKKKEGMETIALAYTVQALGGIEFVDQEGKTTTAEEIRNQALEELRAEFPDFDDLDFETQGTMITSRVNYKIEGMELVAEQARLKEQLEKELAQDRPNPRAVEQIANQISANNKAQASYEARDPQAEAQSRYRPPTKSGSGGGGGGQKSLSEQLSEQLKAAQGMFSALRNVTNNDAFKAFIAGPFAPEFLEYLRNKGEEGLKILKSGIEKIKKEYAKFKKIRMLEIGAEAMVAPFARDEEFKQLQQKGKFTNQLRKGSRFKMGGEGLSSSEIDYVNAAIPPERLALLYQLESQANLNKKEKELLQAIREDIRNAIKNAKRTTLEQDVQDFEANLGKAEEGVKTFNELVSKGLDPAITESLLEMGITAKMASDLSKQELEALGNRIKQIKIGQALQEIAAGFNNMRNDIRATVNIMSALPGITEEAMEEMKGLTENIHLLNPEQIRKAYAELVQLKRAAYEARSELSKIDENLNMETSAIQASIEAINRLEIRPLELRIIVIQDAILPIQDEIRGLEKAIRPLQKEINAFQKEINNLQKKQRPLQKDIEKLREEEEELNKHYEERSKVLDKVSRANEKMIAQQRGQLDIASALSRGDIAGAAQATRELQANMAQQRMDDAKAALEEEREQKRLAITTQIEAKEKEIKTINEQIEEIQEKIEARQETISFYQDLIADKQDIIADKQREIEMIQREIEMSKRKQLELEERIYKVQLLQSMLATKRAMQEAAMFDNQAGFQMAQSMLQAQLSIAGDNPAEFFAGIPGAEQILATLNQFKNMDMAVMSNLAYAEAAAMSIRRHFEQSNEILSGIDSPARNILQRYLDREITFDEMVKELEAMDINVREFLENELGPNFISTLGQMSTGTTEFNKGFLSTLQLFLNGLVDGLNKFFDVVEKAVGDLDITIPPVTLSVSGNVDGIPVSGSVTTSEGSTRANPGRIARLPRPFMYGGFARFTSTEPAPGMAMGGMMKKYATGDFVPGIGITDKVPALLTPGEFVVRKSVAQQYAPLLQSLNSQVYPQFNKFAMGGMVGSMRSMGMNSMFPSFKGITRTQSFPTMQGRTSSIRVSGMNGTAHNSTIDVEYNYSVNVNAQTDASPDDIANAVVHRFRRMEARQVKGTRIG